MPNAHRRKTFKSGQINALAGLLDALKDERIPHRTRCGLTTGLIEECMDDSFLPLQPNALLTVLRESGVPHDSNNRFLTWALYSYEGQIQELFERYMGERMAPLPPGSRRKHPTGRVTTPDLVSS